METLSEDTCVAHLFHWKHIPRNFLIYIYLIQRLQIKKPNWPARSAFLWLHTWKYHKLHSRSTQAQLKVCFIILPQWNCSRRAIRAESNQKSKWLRSTLQDRHGNCFTYRPVFFLYRCQSPAERDMRMMIIIMILDLCALLFCQMNTLNPVVFSYATLKLKNIYLTEWAVNHQTSRGRRARGFAQTATTTEWIKVWYEISCTTKQVGETYMELLRLPKQRETQTACHSCRRQKTAIKVELMGRSFP